MASLGANRRGGVLSFAELERPAVGARAPHQGNGHAVGGRIGAA